MSKFNFNIDTLDNDNDKMIKKQSIQKSQKSSYEDYLFVDLGLPSKTIWCNFNIGVDYNKSLNKAEDWYGEYFAWGEIKPKEIYNWESYKYGIPTKPNTYKKYIYDSDTDDSIHSDGLYTLELEDDAAYQFTKNSAYKCAMPSENQFNELRNNSLHEGVYNYNGIEGLNGTLFTSKINDKSIFFPTAGYKGNATYIEDAGVDGYYWSNNLCADDDVNAVYLAISLENEDSPAIYSSGREYGQTIRAIKL